MAPPDDTRPRKGRTRTATDDSLTEERRKTDAELEGGRRRVQQNADANLERAREDADRRVRLARVRADHAVPQQGHAEEETRTAEDRAVAAEREQADKLLAVTRAEQLRAIADLLRFERHGTDLHLLTERLDADSALSARDNMLGVVSHDLRNLIGGVAVQAALLRGAKDEPGLAEKVQLAGDRLARYAAWMNRLVGDLLDSWSIETGKLAITRRGEDARRALWNAHDTFLQVVKEHQLHASAPEVPVPALIDEDRVLQVLANLLGNALKFTPPGGSIRISIEAYEGGALYCVADSGPGIPEDRMAEIFERGRQLSGTKGGLGLGLFISRAIVEAHGGRIWAEHTTGGARICFTVPGPRAVTEATE